MTWHGNEKKDTVVGKILDRLMSIEMQGTRSFQDDKYVDIYVIKRDIGHIPSKYESHQQGW